MKSTARVLFTVICLFFGVSINAQGIVDIPFTVSDNATSPNSRTVYLGLDPLATDGIDNTLGEGELPPMPPSGNFEARLFLPTFTGSLASYRDYRTGTQYQDGVYEYRLRYQKQSTATTITIAWQIPNHITGVLKDVATNGVIINVPVSGTGSYTVTNPTSFNQLKVFLTYNLSSLLPVELISFSARVVNEAVLLEWRTESELNNYGFEIERLGSETVTRGTGNTQWDKIGFVPAKGNSNAQVIYSFKDMYPPTGKILYRLKQMDNDGSFTYSDPVEVNIGLPLTLKLEQNYPNPFNPSTKISYSIPRAAKVTIQVYNANMELVATLHNGMQSAGQHEMYWNAAGLPSGVYMYSIQFENNIIARKMMLIK